MLSRPALAVGGSLMAYKCLSLCGLFSFFKGFGENLLHAGFQLIQIEGRSLHGKTENFLLFRVREIALIVLEHPLPCVFHHFSSCAQGEENGCPAHQIFAQELSVPFGADTILKNMNQLATCVYIIKNELQGAVMSISLLQEFGLTKRELQLAAFVAEGKNNAEISELMGISTNTVKTHLSNVYKKLGISYRTELMNLLYKMDEESRLK